MQAISGSWQPWAVASVSHSPGWGGRRGAAPPTAVLPCYACLLPGAVLPCERAESEMEHVSWAALPQEDGCPTAPFPCLGQPSQVGQRAVPELLPMEESDVKRSSGGNCSRANAGKVRKVLRVFPGV